jgi:hypothetical protein
MLGSGVLGNVRSKIREKITGEVRYQRPLSLDPWSTGAGTNWRTGTVWISMKPKKIESQTSKGAGTFKTVNLNTEFLFLAPLNLNENIVHHWEAYESVASRLAQKARTAVKLGYEGGALWEAAKNTYKEGKVKQMFENAATSEGRAIESVAADVYKTAPDSTIPRIKVDTPLYYTNSDRRQIVLEFVLFNEVAANPLKPEEILINPIKEMMRYSCPEIKSGIEINFPYMWEVKTVPNDFINYPTCVLIGVQPTWNSPYIDHLPSSVNLQLTFQDLSPLYASTIEKGSIINVINNSQKTGTSAAMNAKAANALRLAGKTAALTKRKPSINRINRYTPNF